MKNRIRAFLRPQGQENVTFAFSSSLTDEERKMIERAQPHSITSAERLMANIDAVRYIIERNVPGALVECGVWRGGSVLVMLWTLLELGTTDRDVYLFDTFEGMTEPAGTDTSRYNESALETWEKAKDSDRRPWDWYFRPEIFGLDEVKALMHGTGYPPARIHFVAGRVEDTLPDQAPADIALLRLDTDWYESTKHELEHLYPRVARGGVLIIDDYGHWDGCRRAVDEYFSTSADPVLLSRIDYSGRIAIKH